MGADGRPTGFASVLGTASDAILPGFAVDGPQRSEFYQRGGSFQAFGVGSAPPSVFGVPASSTPGGPLQLQSVAAPSVAPLAICASCAPQTTSLSREFCCPKCNTTKKVSESTQKGNQVWCDQCSRSYNSLTHRWKTNAKLKKWFDALSKDDRSAWFNTWNKIDPKRRWEMISFTERALEAKEVMLDEIDEWITYETWHREKLLMGWKESTIEAKWVEELERCSAEAVFARCQWLLPRFVGLRRTVRSSTRQEIELFRTVNVNSAAQVEQLWTGGLTALKTYSESIMATKTISPLKADPATAAQPQDMPTAIPAPNMFQLAIAREVVKYVNRNHDGS